MLKEVLDLRLWSYQIIRVLPDKHLLAQWRECVGIANTLIRSSKVNHTTINRLNDYPIIHFNLYCNLIVNEMRKRNFKVAQHYLDNFAVELGFKDDIEFEYLFDEETIKINDTYLFDEWHNDRYLKQCYYMFQEKYDTNMINLSEWEKICSFKLFDKLGY